MEKKGQTAVLVTLIIISLILVMILIIVLWSPIVTGNSISRTSSETPAPSQVTLISSVSLTHCETVRIPYTVRERYSARDYLNYRVVYSSYERGARSSGAYRDRFLVRLKNTDRVGGYFSVKFYLYNSNGKVTKTIKKYLASGETQTFSYPNYGYQVYDWDYEIFSDSGNQNSRYHYVTKYHYEKRCS
ncbi:MAG: hypothetical protein U9Q06_01215 [Nanoarchaeota archaeon]|nr:hypothetical protein [Nanoarchaeota archaeon]